MQECSSAAKYRYMHAHSSRRDFKEVIAILEDRLSRELPGANAQIEMAPVRPDALERTELAERDCREAGVLALLHPLDGRAHVVLTVRRLHLADHAGQVSFPGGRRESDESLLQTALREAQEEVDVRPDDVKVLGELTPLYIPPTNYCVYPYVGYVHAAADLRPHDLEVERIVHVPVAALLNPTNTRREARSVQGNLVEVPFFDVSGLQVWGATAMMLAELVAILRAAD